MGYAIKRHTLRFVNCRPKEYRSSMLYPKPVMVCDKRCPYYIFCKLEINFMTIGERLKEIRLVLQRPYHLFTYLGENEGVMLILEGENKQTKRFSFRGENMIGAIESAERYINSERTVGALRPKG